MDKRLLSSILNLSWEQDSDFNYIGVIILASLQSKCDRNKIESVFGIAMQI